MRKRAGGLYIQNHNLLLICEDHKNFYWTPGGGLENNESYEQALKREIKEELNADLLSAIPYLTIHDKDSEEEVHYFLINIKLSNNLPVGTTLHWYQREEYESNSVSISKRIYEKVYPKLLNDGLI